MKTIVMLLCFICLFGFGIAMPAAGICADKIAAGKDVVSSIPAQSPKEIQNGEANNQNAVAVQNDVEANAINATGNKAAQRVRKMVPQDPKAPRQIAIEDPAHPIRHISLPTQPGYHGPNGETIGPVDLNKPVLQNKEKVVPYVTPGEHPIHGSILYDKDGNPIAITQGNSNTGSVAPEIAPMNPDKLTPRKAISAGAGTGSAMNEEVLIIPKKAKPIMGHERMGGNAGSPVSEEKI